LDRLIVPRYVFAAKIVHQVVVVQEDHSPNRCPLVLKHPSNYLTFLLKIEIVKCEQEVRYPTLTARIMMFQLAPAIMIFLALKFISDSSHSTKLKIDRQFVPLVLPHIVVIPEVLHCQPNLHQ
jgi:hypothetical protein